MNCLCSCKSRPEKFCTRILTAISLFFFQRGQVFVVEKVDFKQQVPLFTLKTLSGTKIRGYWYKANLKSIDRDNLTNRKILKQRFSKKHKQTQVLIQTGKDSSKWINIEELFIPKKRHPRSG